MTQEDFYSLEWLEKAAQSGMPDLARKMSKEALAAAQKLVSDWWERHRPKHTHLQTTADSV